jgi:acetyl-CoA acetyltransferase
MYSQDKARMFSAFDGAWDVHNVEYSRDTLIRMGDGVPVPPGTTSDKPYSVFMDVYAGFCRLHMKTFGTTQRQIAAVAAKNHGHSVHNPLAQYRKPFSIDEVMSAPPIIYPLTLPMCSPVSDGAAAALVCNAAGLAKLKGRSSRAIRVLASVLQTGSDRAPEDYANHATAHAARRAWEQAGIGPQDVSLAEVHDATAMGEIIELEALGLTPLGGAGPAAERGELSLGGRLPVNVSGGLECKGHPIGATGLGQVFELVTQLRGEAGARQVSDARIGLSQNGGGIIGVEEAVVAVTVLGR